jgi:hypothetical protein
VTINTAVFLIVTPCSLVEIFRLLFTIPSISIAYCLLFVPTNAHFLEADVFGRQLFGSSHFAEPYGNVCF